MWGHEILRGGLRDVFAADDGDRQDEPETDGGTQQVVFDGETPVSLDVSTPAGTDVDLDTDRLEAAMNDALAGGDDERTTAPGRVRAAAGSDSTVTPVVASDDGLQDTFDDAFGGSRARGIRDETIQNLAKNTVDYSPAVAEWMLAHDDLVPGLMSRFKALLLGGEGLSVDPADPDSEADQRLADHLQAIYRGDKTVDIHVTPGDVIEHALAANIQHARAVLRAADLAPVALETLGYAKDGATGEAIYIQEKTDYTTFEVEDDRTVETDTETTDDERALRIGEDVFEARLYRTPPLRAVANDVTNKLQLKRLKARKAEIASIGGLYITVTPPTWLSEAEYDDAIQAEDHNYGDDALTKLEVAQRNDLSEALDTLQQYQTATVMSIPENWEVGTIDLPEMDSSFDEMIRGYNDAIARRLLLPLDLLELEKGTELSRNSMMELLFSMIAGWQRELVGVFDGFGAVQADIHGMSGSVEHRLPRVMPEDEQQIVQLLNYAGLLGLSESESRKLANTLEGVDLDDAPDTEEDLPPAGGPDDPDDREASMTSAVGSGEAGE